MKIVHYVTVYCNSFDENHDCDVWIYILIKKYKVPRCCHHYVRGREGDDVFG